MLTLFLSILLFCSNLTFQTEFDHEHELTKQRIRNCTSSSDLLQILSDTTPTFYQFTLATYRCLELIDCDGTDLLTLSWPEAAYQDALFPIFLTPLIIQTRDPIKFLLRLRQIYPNWEELAEPLLNRAMSLKDTKAAFYIHQQIMSAKMSNNQTQFIMNQIGMETVAFLSQFKATQQISYLSTFINLIRDKLATHQFVKQCNALMAAGLQKERMYVIFKVFDCMHMFNITANLRSCELQMAAYKLLNERLLIQMANKTNKTSHLYSLKYTILSRTSAQMVKYSHSNVSTPMEVRKLAQFDIHESAELYRFYQSLQPLILGVIHRWRHALKIVHDKEKRHTQIMDLRGFNNIVIPYLVEHLLYYRADLLEIDLIIYTDSMQDADTVILVLESFEPSLIAYVYPTTDGEGAYLFATEIGKCHSSKLIKDKL